MMGEFSWQVVWGLKTTSLFDVWSFEHFMAGISVGGIVVLVNRRAMSQLPMSPGSHRHAWFDIAGCLFLAYLWETIEHYLENGTAGEAVRYWFQGIEFWGNRLIVDPLLLLLGMLLVSRCPWLAWPARAISTLWLAIHVFVFPHCMYLYEIFDLV
ncbi:MAG: hypothetical protein OXK76_03160 [Gammaproteobacteria bacterium]|nr:hypothetical protein [Gammaproteobacteria bacterium]